MRIQRITGTFVFVVVIRTK